MKKTLALTCIMLFPFSTLLLAIDWNKKDWMDSRKSCMMETEGKRSDVAKLYYQWRFKAGSDDKQNEIRDQIIKLCPTEGKNIPAE